MLPEDHPLELPEREKSEINILARILISLFLTSILPCAISFLIKVKRVLDSLYTQGRLRIIFYDSQKTKKDMSSKVASRGNRWKLDMEL